MTIQELGSIGEVVGGIGVVVSLVYLSIQIRRSSTIEQAAAEQALHQAFYAAAIRLEDEKRLLLLPRGLADWASLSDKEKVEFHHLMVPFIGNLANGLQLREKGLLPDRAFRGIADLMLTCLLTPGGRDWWNEIQRSVTPELAEFLEERLAAPDSLPPPWSELFPFWWRLRG